MEEFLLGVCIVLLRGDIYYYYYCLIFFKSASSSESVETDSSIDIAPYLIYFIFSSSVVCLGLDLTVLPPFDYLISYLLFGMYYSGSDSIYNILRLCLFSTFPLKFNFVLTSSFASSFTGYLNFLIS
jgi:hypothetical protein